MLSKKDGLSCTITGDFDICPIDSDTANQQCRVDGESPFYGEVKCSEEPINNQSNDFSNQKQRSNRKKKSIEKKKTAISVSSFKLESSTEQDGPPMMIQTQDSQLEPTLQQETIWNSKWSLFQSPDRFKIERDGFSLIPKNQNKIEQNQWSFTLSPSFTPFQANCYKNPDKYYMACQVQGSLLDLNVAVETPLGKLDHGITFGSINASIGSNFIPDLKAEQGGGGAYAKGKIDLINSHFNYRSPVSCSGKMGLEFTIGFSASWGWKKEKELSFSLTHFVLDKKAISIPTLWWGTKLNLKGHGGFIRTPNHPQCHLIKKEDGSSLPTLTETESDEQAGYDESALPQEFCFSSQKNNSLSSQNPSLFHQNKSQEEFLLEINYQPKESKTAVKLLFSPAEKSFLQTNYLAPEEQLATRLLTNSRTNPQSFFTPEYKTTNTHLNPTGFQSNVFSTLK